MADALQPADSDAASIKGSGARLIGPYWVLRGNGKLGLLLVGYALATLGTWLTGISLAMHAYTLSHSAVSVALLSFAMMAPAAVFSPLIGMAIDRYDVRKLALWTNAGSALCVLGLTSVRTAAALWIAFVLTLGLATLGSLMRPATNTLLQGMVADEEREAANTLLGQIEALSNVIAPLLGSLLYLSGHPYAAFAVAAAAYAGVAVAFNALPLPHPTGSARPREDGPLGELVAGFRFLFVENDRVLAAVTATVGGLGLVNGAWYTLIVVLAVQSFHVGAQSAGFIDATWAAGSVAGGFLIAGISRRLRFGGLLVIGAAGSAATLALFGLSPAGLLPFVAVVLIGVADAVVLVGQATVLQAATPPELMGRVFGAFEATQVAAMIAGTLAVGPLIAIWGPRGATIIFAVLSAGALALAATRLFRLEQALGVRIYLRQVPMLATLSLRVLDDLGARLRHEVIADGAVIVREGEPGERLYMIKHGTVEVSAQGNRAHPVVVAHLRKMDYFGEIALLHGVPRTATVSAKGAVELYGLDRADFQELVARTGDWEQILVATAQRRRQETHRKTV